MKTEVENQEGYYKKLFIEVPPEKVSEAFRLVFQEIQKDADIKGFRKGKVPLNVVKENYSQNAIEHVTRYIVDSTMVEAIKAESLNPVSSPKVDAKTPLEGFPFKYTVTFENRPPITLNQYDNFKAEFKEAEASEEEVNKSIENICSRMARFEALPADTVSATGNVVEINYSAQENGEEKEEFGEKNGLYEIGMGILGEDFEKNLTGLKIGDTKDFQVTYAADKKTPDGKEHKLAGKTLDYSLRLTAIKEKVTPELDDELAKKLGNFENAEAVKKAIKEEVVKNKNDEKKEEIRQALVEYLVEKNPVDAPETMLKNQVQQSVMSSAQRLEQMGMAQSEIEEKLKTWQEDIHKQSEQQVKTSLLLAEISEKEKIQAEEEDVRREIIQMAQMTGKNPQDVAKELEEKGLFGGMIQQITEAKTLEWLLQKAIL